MRRAVIGMAVLAGLVSAGLAHGKVDQSATWQVAVGEQGKPPAGTPKGTTLNQFFPGRIAINAGDKVSFTAFAFHTVSYLAGKPVPALIAPAKGLTYQGITDSASQPFYFEGLPLFQYNAPVFGPFGPKTISGKTPASSGAIFATSRTKPAKAEYTFPKPGVFKLLCQVHRGMEMTVAVKPQGAAVPSAEDVAAKAKAETEAAWAKAKPLAAASAPTGTVIMGVGGKTAILDFLPALSKVKAGSTVTFVNRSPSEVHNVALGPLKYMDKFMRQTDLFPTGPGSKNQVTPIFVYGTDPKGTAYTKTIHGNGFFATPLADGARGGLPNAVRVTFAEPGTYKFICLLHGPDMSAAIRVTK